MMAVVLRRRRHHHQQLAAEVLVIILLLLLFTSSVNPFVVVENNKHATIVRSTKTETRGGGARGRKNGRRAVTSRSLSSLQVQECDESPNFVSPHRRVTKNNDHLSGEGTGRSRKVQWVQSIIQLDNISLSYPQTLWRKLTSSIPYRQYALNNISLTIKGGRLIGSGSDIDVSEDDVGPTNSSNRSTKTTKILAETNNVVVSNLILLVGASSSGKSALLKVLAGDEKRTTGCVSILTNQGVETAKAEEASDVLDESSSWSSSPDCPTTANPIILDDTSPYLTTRRYNSLHERLQQRLMKLTMIATDNCDDGADDQQQILQEISRACGLLDNGQHQNLKSSEGLIHKSPTELSPSEYFKFKLAEACVSSSCWELSRQRQRQRQQHISKTTSIPGPILFLDEWFDVETSEVVQNVMPALKCIINDLNGIVVCVTHKPHLFRSSMIATTREPQEQPMSKQRTTKRTQHLSLHSDNTMTCTLHDQPALGITSVTLSAGKILSIETM
jgi:energy-coupling factor transporter ATP-binding protein EcfA2